MIDYLYYSFYRWLSTTHEKDIAEYTAVFIFAFCVCANLIVLFGLLGFDNSTYFSARVYGLILFVSTSLLFYLKFVRNKKYKELDIKFQNLGQEKVKLMNVTALLSVFESFLVVIIATIFK